MKCSPKSERWIIALACDICMARVWRQRPSLGGTFCQRVRARHRSAQAAGRRGARATGRARRRSRRRPRHPVGLAAQLAQGSLRCSTARAAVRPMSSSTDGWTRATACSRAASAAWASVPGCVDRAHKNTRGCRCSCKARSMLPSRRPGSPANGSPWASPSVTINQQAPRPAGVCCGSAAGVKRARGATPRPVRRSLGAG